MSQLSITVNVSGPVDDDIKFWICTNHAVTDSDGVQTKWTSTVCENDTVYLELYGKEDKHTVLEGNTVVDSVLVTVTSVLLDDVDITDKFISQCTYIHNHNGQVDPVTDQFYGSMGFNGVVSMKFDQEPVAWLANLC